MRSTPPELSAQGAIVVAVVVVEVEVRLRRSDGGGERAWLERGG